MKDNKAKILRGIIVFSKAPIPCALRFDYEKGMAVIKAIDQDLIIASVKDATTERIDDFINTYETMFARKNRLPKRHHTLKKRLF